MLIDRAYNHGTDNAMMIWRAITERRGKVIHASLGTRSSHASGGGGGLFPLCRAALSALRGFGVTLIG